MQLLCVIKLAVFAHSDTIALLNKRSSVCNQLGHQSALRADFISHNMYVLLAHLPAWRKI